MNVLVTGGAGYIGSHAVKRLLKEGHTVVVTDNLSKGYRAAVPPKAIFVKVNIGNMNAMVQAMQDYEIEAVMHFAGFIEVGESVTHPAKYYNNNLIQGIALLNTMRKCKVKKLIFSSTAAVYGEPLYTPIDEAHRCAPVSPYGFTKYMMEQIIADYAKAYGLSYVALRYFNVAGACPDCTMGEAHEPESHLIPRILNVAQGKGDYISIFGTDYQTRDGTCIRDYIHVEDLISAHILALHRIRSVEGGFTYNVGSQCGFTVREVIDACRKMTGVRIRTRDFPKRAGDPGTLVASSEKIKSELGWRMKYPNIETIVQHAWHWHSQHPKGYKNDEIAPDFSVSAF